MNNKILFAIFVMTSSSLIVPMSRQEKDDVIQRALRLEIDQVDQSTASAEIDQLRKTMLEKVGKSEYEDAIAVVVAALEKYPRSFMLQADFASLVGDCSEITENPLKDKMIEKSKAVFNKLMGETDLQPKDYVYSFRNEYCFRFGHYYEQYKWGKKRVDDSWKTDEWAKQVGNGYYCQGVGATYYAKQLLGTDKSRALKYAQKAVVAWGQHFSHENDYYNSYVHYALALGILGYKKEMFKALERSASLIKRDLTYHEFKEVIDFVEQIK